MVDHRSAGPSFVRLQPEHPSCRFGRGSFPREFIKTRAAGKEPHPVTGIRKVASAIIRTERAWSRKR